MKNDLIGQAVALLFAGACLTLPVLAHDAGEVGKEDLARLYPAK